MMTVFYLLRHGHADYALAEKGRLGVIRRDLVPLTSRGYNQIESIVDHLRAIQAELIISSPVTRALQSAAILSRHLDLALEVEFDLHEWIPDLTFSDDRTFLVREAYREMLNLNGEWAQDQPRNWEPLSSLRQRVINVLRCYCGLNRVIVVCHGIIITSLTGKEVDTGGYCPYVIEGMGSTG